MIAVVYLKEIYTFHFHTPSRRKHIDFGDTVTLPGTLLGLGGLSRQCFLVTFVSHDIAPYLELKKLDQITVFAM